MALIAFNIVLVTKQVNAVCCFNFFILNNLSSLICFKNNIHKCNIVM